MKTPTARQVAVVLAISLRQAQRLMSQGNARAKLVQRAWQAALAARKAAPTTDELSISAADLAAGRETDLVISQKDWDEAVARMEKRFPRRRHPPKPK